ncbi:hypothetical protein [Pedobacter panaciterrae]
MPYKALKIDELTIMFDHHHIDADDECYHIMDYVKGAGYNTVENSMILNFKKSLEYKGASHWHYKDENLHKLKRIFFSIYLPLLKNLGLSDATLIPIPPSKAKDNPLHDDRMLRLLNLSFPSCDVREILLNKKSMNTSHNAEVRHTVQEIYDNLKVDRILKDDLSEDLILFDDVITSGAHFKACKQKLQEEFPNSNIYGFFIARRVGV